MDANSSDKNLELVDEFPLSHGQRALWFLQHLAPKSVAHNLAYTARLPMKVDVAALRRALQGLVDRHPVLRTTFAAPDDEPVQRVHAHMAVCFQVEDAAGWSEAAWDERLAQETYRPFDLERGPLMRVSLFTRSPQDHVLFLVIHHSVTDMWSLALWMYELGEFYAAETTGLPLALKPLRATYADHVREESQMLDGPEGERLWAYWQKQLSGVLPVLNLPTDRPRPAVQTDRGGLESLRLEAELVQALKSLGRAHGTTLFTTMLATFQVLLHRYTGQTDVLVGSPKARRSRRMVRVMGYFVNPVVLRADLAGTPTFAAFLQQMHQTVQGAFEHDAYPFPLLVERLQPERDLSRPPIFQVMFAWQKTTRLVKSRSMTAFALSEEGEGKVDLSGLIMEPMPLSHRPAPFDWTLLVAEAEDELVATVEYNCDLFEPATIRRMLEHYCTLLQSIVATAESAERRVSDLPLLTVAERRQLLLEWNDTAAPYPQDQCVQQLFEAQVARTPDAVAVVFEGESLTYGELNRQANQLAHHLQELGVGPETLVGITVERSPDMILGLLGVLKAGGAYLPLDPTYPPERLAYMLEDARASLLLTQAHLQDRLAQSLIPNIQYQTLYLDAEWATIAHASAENPVSAVTPDNLAYVIYTSGSTGRPKGVMLQHRGLCNLVHAQARAFGVGADSRVLQFASFSFDAAVSEIFMALLTGAALHLTRQETLVSPVGLHRLLRDRAITTVTLPPSMLKLLPEQGLADLQTLVSAGEVCPPEVAARWVPGRRLFNAYGPTETTIGPTVYPVPDELPDPANVSIGRPIANIQVYVLDTRGQPVPIGVPGQLHIGGVGLARGYLNRPGLTATKFVPHPFGVEPGARLYRTGDLARYRSDGTLEFLGRTDYQVKVRGFRIEPGEIEAVLERHAAVQEAFVTARQDGPAPQGPGQRLVAYVVFNGEPAPTSDELRDHLRAQLPEYMVPAALVPLDALPLTSSGKVDRRALPAPNWSRLAANGAWVAPRTPTEELLAGVWAQVLGVEQVGVHDSFFDLGGHSLLATQVVSRLRETLQFELPVRYLFEAPTVAHLARSIEIARQAAHDLSVPPIEPVAREADVELPLSFAQQRLWFLDRFEPDSAFYNMPGAARLSGPLDVSALNWGLNEIVRRHEALRTTFVAENGRPRQVIAPELFVPMPVVDLADLTTALREAEAQRLTIQEGQRSFDLPRGPLLHVLLLRLDEKEHILLLTMHHIVSDNWSMGVTIRELATLYRAHLAGESASLPELPIQYADFAHWQQQWLHKETLKSQLDYWKEQLQGLPPLLELPTDRPRPAVQTYRGANRWFKLPVDLSQALRDLSQENGVTLFMTLLAAFQTLLYRYTGQADVAVGTPIANRNRTETEGLIGFFVNTLVLRGDLSGAPSFRELLGRVREAALGAYDHQDVPFEMLVDALQPARDLSHSPLFQVMFALQNAQMQPLELPGLALDPLEVDSGTAKFDLTLSLEDGADGLSGHWNYNSDLFDATTIDRLVGHFQKLLESIVVGPDRSVSALPLLTEAERAQLLLGWNDTAMDYGDHCVHERFEMQVARAPEALAVVFAVQTQAGQPQRASASTGGAERVQDQALTYEELNRRANQLAHHLQKLGVGPETLVGISIERSLEMMVGLLGVLKAGGAYLPLDPNYPPERLAYMLEDARVLVLLTQAHLRDRLAQSLIPTLAHLPWPGSARDAQFKVICLDTDWEAIAHESVENPASNVTPDDLAYVIYTSGSTGRPKGVMLKHRGLHNLVSAQTRAFDVGTDSRVLQFASFSFDASISETFMALLTGATLCLARSETLAALPDLHQLLRDQAITTVTLPPSLLKLLPVEGLSDLQTLISAGEACSPDIVTRWAPGRCMFNAYGPTEATIGPTLGRVEALPVGATSVPIGRPIANTQIYLLDASLEPVPVGVPGELYVGGLGVGRGYLNRSVLTAERFVPDPFAPPALRAFLPGGGAEGGTRLYKTGDLARYLPDGRIEFLGRTDHQVKLRGFRIELGEIEAALERHTAVQEAVVLARGGRDLIGYVVLDQSSRPAINELRDFVRARLPEYMVPSTFVPLETLPLTPSGKVDRRALPDPTGERPELETTFVKPQNEVQLSIASVWQQVLGIEKIGIHDNFFDLGGHSLTLAQVHSQLQEMLSRRLSLVDMFRYPTISALAEFVSREPEGQLTFHKDLDRASKQKAALQRQQRHMQRVTPKMLAQEQRRRR